MWEGLVATSGLGPGRPSSAGAGVETRIRRAMTSERGYSAGAQTPEVTMCGFVLSWYVK